MIKLNVIESVNVTSSQIAIFKKAVNIGYMYVGEVFDPREYIIGSNRRV